MAGITISREIRLGEIITICVLIFGIGAGFSALRSDIREEAFRIQALEQYNTLQDANARKTADILEAVVNNQQDMFRWRAAHQALADAELRSSGR